MSVTSLRAPTAAACLLVAACELPELPIVEQRWIVPVEETVVDVDELLPNGVVVDPTGAAFDVSVPQVSASETLGDLCGPPCIVASGLMIPVPVPPFSATFSSSEALPPDVLSATIAGAQVDIEIVNGFSFDPLAGGGTLEIVVTDEGGGGTVGQLALDGASEALAPGSTTTRSVTLTSGVVISGPLAATASLDVVGGQVATIDAADVLGVSVTTDPLGVSSITVAVAGRAVDIESTDLEADELDAWFTDAIMSGTILLDISNPFGAGVDGDIDIGGVTKTFSITDAPTSTVDLTYTGDELRSFLGLPGVALTGSGTVVGGPVTISPGIEMRIGATLDVVVRFGS
jgi:hypothetical protein